MSNCWIDVTIKNLYKCTFKVITYKFYITELTRRFEIIVKEIINDSLADHDDDEKAQNKRQIKK